MQMISQDEMEKLPMSDAKFEKVQQSDVPLYGPIKLILCGFPAAARDKMARVMEMAGIADVPVVWADTTHQNHTLGELLAPFCANDAPEDAAPLPRAVIVSGITQNQLHALMGICRQTGMREALWATLTPTSENWTLGQLLRELAAERSALSQSRNAGPPH